MLALVIGFVSAIYLFARKIVDKEPLKGKISSIFGRANSMLGLYKDKSPNLVLEQLYIFSNKILLYSLIATLFSSFIFKSLYKDILTFISVFFFVCFMLSFSISWMQKHNKTFKEYFFNYQSLVIIFFSDTCILN